MSKRFFPVSGSRFDSGDKEHEDFLFWTIGDSIKEVLFWARHYYDKMPIRPPFEVWEENSDEDGTPFLTAHTDDFTFQLYVSDYIEELPSLLCSNLCDDIARNLVVPTDHNKNFLVVSTPDE